MIVGFKILDLQGYVQEAIDYISSVIYVPNPIDVATAIVNKYETTNIFSSNVTQADLDGLPFTTQAIEFTEGIFCWSIVDFTVEMFYRDYDNAIQKITLLPTGYIDNMLLSVARQLTWYRDKNYINFIPPGIYNTADFDANDFLAEDWLTPLDVSP